MIIGYARVSTKDQNLDLQLNALKIAGCNKIYKEKMSAIKDRPELETMVSELRSGDTVIVWKLDYTFGVKPDNCSYLAHND